MNIQLTSQQQARSRALIEFIKDKTHGAAIPFSQFMEWILYTPELGYYAANDHLIGKDGDFVTAPNLSPLFAEAFAQIFIEVFTACGTAAILELGAGQGCFAKAVLHALHDRGVTEVRYVIVEKSPALQARQQRELKNYTVEWLSDLPHEFSGVVFANEVLDALPVDCFLVEQGKIRERGVALQGESFQWTTLSSSTESFQHAEATLIQLQRTHQWTENFYSEWHSEAKQLITRLSKMLKHGSMILVDYGYAEQEYYRRERNTGTLMCFIQHQKHDNPLLFPGLQDVTAHVNFSLLAETACDHHLQLSGYTTQAMCLLGLGIESLAARYLKTLSPAQQTEVTQALKILLLPNQMGERVRCMMLNKNHELVVPAFQIRDMRGEL